MNSLARDQGPLSTCAHPTGIRNHASSCLTLLQGTRSPHAVPLVHLPPPGHAAHFKRSYHSPLGAELAGPDMATRVCVQSRGASVSAGGAGAGGGTSAGRRRRRAGDREVPAPIVFAAATGCSWRQLPHVLRPAWSTVHRRFAQWSQLRVLARLPRVILDEPAGWSSAPCPDWQAAGDRPDATNARPSASSPSPRSPPA
ncbi:transposase [Streptomyces sp. NRRL S-340]|uniref:transposase n=1 Tax=Streptomyces sp. NRRL S-340 TaxID=1463901 RepID=UPI00099DDD6F